jgi:hypothetical protein
VRQPRPPERWLRRILDHAYYWRTGAGPLDGSTEFVITTNPYHVFDDYRRDAAKIARKVGAKVEFPDFPSWWNYDPRSRSEQKTQRHDPRGVAPARRRNYKNRQHL